MKTAGREVAGSWGLAIHRHRAPREPFESTTKTSRDVRAPGESRLVAVIPLARRRLMRKFAGEGFRRADTTREGKARHREPGWVPADRGAQKRSRNGTSTSRRNCSRREVMEEQRQADLLVTDKRLLDGNPAKDSILD